MVHITFYFNDAEPVLFFKCDASDVAHYVTKYSTLPSCTGYSVMKHVEFA